MLILVLKGVFEGKTAVLWGRGGEEGGGGGGKEAKDANFGRKGGLLGGGEEGGGGGKEAKDANFGRKGGGGRRRGGSKGCQFWS